jgi:hypothetical protein
MGTLLLLFALMNLHLFCCPFSPSYHVFPFSTFAVIRQQSLSGGNSDDAQPYQERQVQNFLKQVQDVLKKRKEVQE